MSDTPTNDDLRASATHVLLDEPAGLDQVHIDIGDDLEHHLRRVLRLRAGERVSVTDGEGRWRMCVVAGDARLALEAVSDVATVPEPSGFTIASAIPKGDRVDWLVQKTTELGAGRVLLLHTERSATRWKPERATKQVHRLQRIADEALRQSRRVWRCMVEGPVDAVDVLGRACVAEPGGEPLRGDEALVAVGPEGGWSTTELERAARRVSIGPHILRTETAAIAATTLRMADHPLSVAFFGERRYLSDCSLRRQGARRTSDGLRRIFHMVSFDDDAPSAYSQQVGDRLRVIRKQKRLSLQEVEAQSSQEFKASVLGAYERGERALSVPRLDRLAQFYAVPIEQLLPREITGTETEFAALESPLNKKLAIDVSKLMQLRGSPFEMLARYLRLIQVQRQDFNGRVMTVRGDDTRAIAAMLDVPVDQVGDRLLALDLLFR